MVAGLSRGGQGEQGLAAWSVRERVDDLPLKNPPYRSQSKLLGIVFGGQCDAVDRRIGVMKMRSAFLTRREGYI